MPQSSEAELLTSSGHHGLRNESFEDFSAGFLKLCAFEIDRPVAYRERGGGAPPQCRSRAAHAINLALSKGSSTSTAHAR